MAREAEAHAAEDAKKKEEVEVRNMADTLVYTAERTIREQGDKIPADLKQQVDGKIAAVRSALQGKDANYIRSATQELSEVMQKVGAAVYQQAGTPPPPPGGGAPGGTPGETPGGEGWHCGGRVQGSIRLLKQSCVDNWTADVVPSRHSPPSYLARHLGVFR